MRQHQTIQRRLSELADQHRTHNARAIRAYRLRRILEREANAEIREWVA